MSREVKCVVIISDASRTEADPEFSQGGGGGVMLRGWGGDNAFLCDHFFPILFR